ARARWRAAEDRLYPTLIANPMGYQKALTDIQAVVAELRTRSGGFAVLRAVEADPTEVLKAACPGGISIPADLMVGVACGMRDRELSAEQHRQRAERAVAEARAAGRAWAPLSGPEQPEDLTDGQLVALHLPSKTALRATVDPWSGEPPFTLGVTGPDGVEAVHTFAERDRWLAEYRRTRAEIEAAGNSTLRTASP
ncbi:MAG TPA: hypothetical protein VGH89_24215, partial [Pseudonocardia sp.]